MLRSKVRGGKGKLTDDGKETKRVLLKNAFRRTGGKKKAIHFGGGGQATNEFFLLLLLLEVDFRCVVCVCVLGGRNLRFSLSLERERERFHSGATKGLANGEKTSPPPPPPSGR